MFSSCVKSVEGAFIKIFDTNNKKKINLQKKNNRTAKKKTKIISSVMEDIKEVSIIIKWSGKEYPITDLTEHCTVAILKHEIMKKTQVRPERQKLLNLKYKGKSFFFVIFRCFCLKSHGFCYSSHFFVK